MARGRTIDRKEWLAIGGLSAGVSTATTLIGGIFTPGLPVTILRCRCPHIYAFMDNTRQAGDTLELTFGLGIVSQDAGALGATAMPDPAAEPDYPWLWWGSMFLDSDEAAVVNSWGPQAQIIHDIDTKAMRKMKPRESLVWVAQSASVTGAPAVRFQIAQTRVLVGR